MKIVQTLKRILGHAPENADCYRCTNCGRDFAYTADLPDPDCPYCDSTDLRSLDDR